MFTTKEIAMIRDAIGMAIKSNERMKASKPQYNIVFEAMARDLGELELKLRNLAIENEKTTKNK